MSAQSVLHAIDGISTDDIYALTTTQGNAFTQAQIDSMSLEQALALADVVTP